MNVLLAALLLFGLAAQPAAATLLSVSGNGSVTLAPTLATVDASITTTGLDAAAALAQNDAAYDRIVAALLRLGIARGDVRLSYFNLTDNPPPSTPPSGTNERYGFTVSRGFSVRVRSIGKTGNAVDVCTTAGATGIEGVRFGLADPRAARAQAEQEAVRDARAKAAALASAAGLHIVGIARIDMGTGAVGPQPLMMARTAAGTQFDQGGVTETASVSVTFQAQP